MWETIGLISYFEFQSLKSSASMANVRDYGSWGQLWFPITECKGCNGVIAPSHSY